MTPLQFQRTVQRLQKDRKDRQNAVAFASLIASPAGASFTMPANKELFAYIDSAVGANTLAITTTGTSNRTVYVPPSAAGTYHKLGYFEKGTQVTVEAGISVVVTGPTGTVQGIAGDAFDPIGGGGPIGENAPTANDKTFSGLTLSAPESLVLTETALDSRYVDLLVDDTFTGRESFNLHPLDYLSFPVTTNVAFTVPVPFGVCTDVSQVRILQGGVEVPSTVEALGYWRDGQSQSLPRGAYVRSVLVRMNVNFPSSTPKVLEVDFTEPRTSEANLTFALSTVRHTIDTSTFFPSEYAAGEAIWEPNCVAVFATDWLTACTMKTRVRPLDPTDTQWENLEGNYQAAGYTYPTNGGGTYAGDPVALPKLEHFMKTMVNDVRPHVTPANLITYEGSGNYAPWLYDRAGTLWLAYLRTGDVKWWRHAHRASQFYQNHISVTGYFDLRADDLKYSYGRSMLIDYWMTGDSTLLATIETAALPSASGAFNETYTYVEFTGANSIPQWTERNQAYALLAQLDAYEATGTASYLTRAKAIFDAAYAMQQDPNAIKTGWVKDGGCPHTIMSHEGGTGGGTGNEPVTSPWMSAILLDAVMRYYIVTEDANALTFMADYGDYYANVPAYTATTGEINGYTVPWYLASDADGVGFTFTDSGDLSDMEHVPDVLGAMAKCLWAKALKGQSTTALQTAFNLFYSTLNDIDWTARATNGVIGYWIRDAQETIDAGQTLNRLAPPRKGSWWFNSASDLTYLERVVNG